MREELNDLHLHIPARDDDDDDELRYWGLLIELMEFNIEIFLLVLQFVFEIWW